MRFPLRLAALLVVLGWSVVVPFVTMHALLEHFVHRGPSGLGAWIVDGPGGGTPYQNRVILRGNGSDNTSAITVVNNGKLWLDREPHLAAILPGTEGDRAQREQLMEKLARVAA